MYLENKFEQNDIKVWHGGSATVGRGSSYAKENNGFRDSSMIVFFARHWDYFRKDCIVAVPLTQADLDEPDHRDNRPVFLRNESLRDETP